MPIIHANVREGFGQKKAKAIIQGITSVFVEVDVPQHAVEVIVHETPKSHWGLVGSRPRRSSKTQFLEPLQDRLGTAKGQPEVIAIH